MTTAKDIMTRDVITVSPETEIAQGKATQEAVHDILQALDPDTHYKDREAFTKALKAQARSRGVRFAASVLKAVLSSLSERDETAEVCAVKGQPEPDTDCRGQRQSAFPGSCRDRWRRRRIL